MRLPSLNALRAFEAAARHEGFVGASAELHVTRGAISRQVKLLEEELGARLFHRSGKGVELTQTGKRLLPVLSEAFERIRAEATRIAAGNADLRVICPPTTSIRWLIPKLDAFRELHPDIRIRLTTDFFRERSFDTQEFDLGFSVANWPNRAANIEVVILFPVRLTPACAPSLLQGSPRGAGRLTTPQDLKSFTLLHETPRHADWSAWLEAFAVDGVDPRSGNEFPNLDMATRAAVMGTGLVMADLVLNRDELEAGTLVMPFPEMICDSPLGGVCLLVPHERADEPRVRAFVEWACQAAGAETAPLDAR